MEKINKSPRIEKRTVPEDFPFDMYNLPGQDIEIAKYWYKKYQEADSKFENKIKSEDFTVRLEKCLDSEESQVDEKLEALKLSKNITDNKIKEKRRASFLKLLDKDSVGDILNILPIKTKLSLINYLTEKLSKDDTKDIIMEGLNDKDWDIQSTAILKSWPSEEEDIINKRKEVIEKALTNENMDIKITALSMSRFINDENVINLRKEIIRENINNTNRVIRLRISALAKDIKEDDINKQLDLLKKEELEEGDLIGHERLYTNSNQSDGFGEKLNKTGSDLILIKKLPWLDKSLEGKIIVRVINLSSFLAWKKSYEDYKTWKENGFDYVPIEPIISFSLEDNMKVKVYCAVLDKSIFDIKFVTRNNKLHKVLGEQGIFHGHMHAGNVCTYFYRDEKGNIIKDKEPRQYIIDFDDAVLLD